MSERAVSAYIGLGSNIEPERHIAGALDAFRDSCAPVAVSTLYRSAPVGFAGPDFVNAVARITCRMGIEALVEWLKSLEFAAGRKRLDNTGSRELDLDLLLYGDTVMRKGKLVLPRPDILEYAFVLRPLAELAPTARHPETGHDFAWHWAHFEGMATALEPLGPPLAGGPRDNGEGAKSNWSG